MRYFALMAAAAVLLCSAANADTWQARSLPAGAGHLSVSLGAQYWKDYFRIRNLIARGEVDLGDGLRGHLGLRRREGSWQKGIRPDIDEAYLEWARYAEGNSWTSAASLRVGRVRYLRFPEPDNISQFDQVPGIADLTGGAVTDYRGALLAVETSHRSGLGANFGGIWWGFQPLQSGLSALEAYLFVRPKLPWSLKLEARAGSLAPRPEPLGRPARPGASLFAGFGMGEFNVGGLVERLRGSPVYTGVMVQFRPTRITRFLGEVGFDYARRPQGLAAQVDLWSIQWGFASKPADGDMLVGEIRARRVRTYWQQSFQRNEYEHRISASGTTEGRGLKVVVEEKPWHLELESLVSPHTGFNRRWLRDRQGPAQLVQYVTYRFYRTATSTSQ